MGIKNFLWLLLLAMLWGPSFIFIKIAVEDIPPLTMVVGRVGLAALALHLLLRLQGRSLRNLGGMWKHVAMMALVHNAVPFTLFSWGEQHIDSALAAILNGATPLFTIVLAHLFIVDDRMTPRKVSGMLVGFGGVVVLIGPALLDGLEASTLGLLAVAFAAFCYGVAIVYSRKYLRQLPPLVAPTAQLTLATLYLLPFSLFIEQPYNLPLPSLASVGAMLMLAIFGTAIAFVVYYHLIAKTSATYVSTVTYMIPVVGIVLGVVVLDEQLYWNAYAGCALILAGVMMVNGVFGEIRRRLVRPADAIA